MRTKSIQKLDYSGHNIYIGMDVHKKTWGISIMTEYLEHKTFIQQADPNQLSNYLHRNFPNANYYSAYEAGFCGFWISHELEKLGINNIVINPADIPTTNKERKNKTDKRDARKIAQMLRSNSLQAIYVPSQGSLEDRQLVRSRKQLVKDGKRCKNRIKSTLNLFGIIVPEEYDQPYWSKAFIKWIKELKCASTLHQSIAHQLAELEYIEKQKKIVDTSIVALACSPKYSERVELLRSIKGIGLLGAMTIITELIDIERFKRPDELHSYAGLIPNMHSSGEKEYIGNITSRSNPYLRPLLIQCAWIASKKDPELCLTYTELRNRGMKSNRAIIKIAKKLLNRIRFVWRTGEKLE
jgi:transposase